MALVLINHLLLDRPPSLSDYEVIGGVPVRTIEFKNELRCHAFSGTGQLFATGDRSRRVKIWRTADYSLVGVAHDVNAQSMSFLDGEHQVLRIVEYQPQQYRVVDLDINAPFRGEDLMKAREVKRIEGKERRTIIKKIEDLPDAQLSEDGSTLMICEPGRPIKVYRFDGDNVLLQEEIDSKFLEEDGRDYDRADAVLSSPGGHSLFGVYHQAFLRQPHWHGLIQPRIVVWPRLQFTEEESEFVIIGGSNAAWLASGEYLAVWAIENGMPQLTVYRTEDLAEGTCNAISSKKFSPELSDWKVICCRQTSVIIREDYQCGKQRFLEWDFEHDTVCHKVSVPWTSEINRFSVPVALAIECPDDSETDDQSVVLPTTHRRHQCFCIDDSRQWIGAYTKHPASMAIMSLCSGAPVFMCSLPKDDGQTTRGIVFNRSGRHFLVIRSEEILAFAPTFLQHSESLSASTIENLQEALWDADDACLRDAFTGLSNFALAKLCNSLGLRRDRDAYSNVFYQVALSSNGTHGVWTGWKMQGPHGRQTQCAGILQIQRLPNSDFGKWKAALNEIPLDGFEPSHVFIYPHHSDGDHLIFFAAGPEPKLLKFEMDGSMIKERGKEIQLGLENCLHISQTRDRSSLVIVQKKSVCLLSLKTMRVTEEIPYNLDIGKVFERLKAQFRLSNSWWRKFIDHRHVSDDGRRVLLGWDKENERSIFVNPTTQQQECEAMLNGVGDGLSPFCKLTGDGSCSLFVDEAELSNGRLVIGIHSHKGNNLTPQQISMMDVDRKPRNRVCVVEDVALGQLTQSQRKVLIFSDISCQMTDDAAEVVVFMASQQDRLNNCYHFKIQIKRFSIYCTEECIPDYDRFVSSEGMNGTEKVQQLAKRFGFDWVFNHPISNGKSIFQEAYVKDDNDIVQSVMNLADQQKIKLNAQWKPTSTAETEDLMKCSLKMNPFGKAEEAIKFMKSGACTDQDFAWMCSQNLAEGLESNPERVIKALIDDELIHELCQVEVNAAFLHPTTRRNVAVHVSTVDDLLDWDGHPALLAEKWNANNHETIRAMEGEGKTATTVASLKAVYIENAGLLGSKGLIRHLIRHKVPEIVFRSKAVKWIVSHKWFKFWRKKFLLRGLMHVGFLVFLTAYAMILGRTSDLVTANMTKMVSASLLLPFLWAYGIVISVEERKEIASLMDEGMCDKNCKWWGARYYFSSKWNWVDVASCLLLILLIPLFHILSAFVMECNPFLSAAVAMQVLLAYIKVIPPGRIRMHYCSQVWYFAQPFRETGALVLLVEKVIRDCAVFLALALNVLLGYALAIHVMSRSITNGYKKYHETMESLSSGRNIVVTNDDVNDVDIGNDKFDNNDKDVYASFGTFRSSILTLFYALFGEFDSEVYATRHELSRLILCTFLLYMITQIIVLLNLLISIMSDTFDKVKSNEEGQMLKARALIIDSCEASASTKEIEDIKKKTRKYVCAVENLDGVSDDAYLKAWSGRLNMIIDNIKAFINKIEVVMRNTVEKEANTSRNEVKEQVNEVMHRMEALEATKGEVKEALEATKGEVKEALEATKGEVKALKTTISEQDGRIAAVADQMQQHSAEHTSALASLEARMQQNSQEVSTKLESILALLQNST